MYKLVRPKDPGSWHLLATSHMMVRGAVSSERLAREGIVLHPNDPELLTDLADALMYQAKFEEAERILEQVIGEHPESTAAWVSLADLAKLQHNWELVKARAKQAEDRLVDAEDAQDLVGLAAILLATPGQREWAERLLRDATLESRNYWAHIVLSVLSEGQHPHEAKRHLDQAIRYWDGSKETFHQYVDSIREQLAGIER